MDYKSIYETALFQLKNTVKKDSKRKVCKDCGELGHNNIKNIICPLKIKYENNMKNKIKNYVLLLDCLSEEINDELFEKLSLKLNISSNLCKKLYSEIPVEGLLERQMDIKSYISNINKKKCFECGTVLYDIQKKTNKRWKGNTLCDSCWCSHSEERETLWREIKEYKQVICCICNKPQDNNERFHYDHLNMFEKGDSICCMVSDGDDISDIYNEIDKCQIVCVPCHHLITDIENKIGFTRIKTLLTKKLNNEELTPEDYIDKVKYYQDIYKIKMDEVYNKLKSSH